MTDCRYDRDTDTYVTLDGERCDVPRSGHCTAKRGCSHHVGWGELICARCLGDARRYIRRIAETAPLLDTAALESRRIDSEATMLAGPTVDPEAWSWRKAAAKNHRDYGVGKWHVSLEEDDDETDPERVLTTWAQMLSEDYELPRPDRWDVTNAAAFLDRILHRVAHDEEQDFPRLSQEMRRCKNHLDAQLRVRAFVERGVPCPTCVEAQAAEPTSVRLVREYPHWCESETCERIHVATDELDVWVCPRDRSHWWTHAAYSNWLEERRGA